MPPSANSRPILVSALRTADVNCPAWVANVAPPQTAATVTTSRRRHIDQGRAGWTAASRPGRPSPRAPASNITATTMPTKTTTIAPDANQSTARAEMKASTMAATSAVLRAKSAVE